MSTDDPDWIEGGGLVGFQWASNNTELLIQQDECFRLFKVSPEITEQLNQQLDRYLVIGWGHAQATWWFLLKEQEQVMFRKGFDNEAIVLDQASSEEVSQPVLSPDGKVIACTFSGSSVGFWSVDKGKRIFIFKMKSEDLEADIFGSPRIENLSWSNDSRYLAITMAFPVHGVTVIDVTHRKILQTIE